jgi:hypothetical protein
VDFTEVFDETYYFYKDENTYIDPVPPEECEQLRQQFQHFGRDASDQWALSWSLLWPTFQPQASRPRWPATTARATGSLTATPFATVPRKLKAEINRAFWRRMCRRYGDIAYIHGLHEQHGLLHVNYHTLSDRAFEPDVVFEFWRLSLPIWRGLFAGRLLGAGLDV